MAPKKPDKPAIIGTRAAMKILDRDRATVIRWGREGRFAIIGQLEGVGAFLFDRASVEKFAATENELFRRYKGEAS
jgi:hypothetical protein